MTNPPPRKRFQIHLSTAIVMMFVAGGIIWANALQSDGSSPEGAYRRYTYGWPLEFYHRQFYGDILLEATWGVYYPYARIIIDLVVALAILFSTHFLCEWLIRRRAARKGS